MRLPVAWLLAAVIALSAVTVYFYLSVISPAVPAYVDPPGGTYQVPNGTAFLVKASGSTISVSANATAVALYAQFLPMIVTSGLPQGVVIKAGPDLYVASLAEGLYAMYVFKDASGYEQRMCTPLSAQTLESGLLLLLPVGATDYYIADSACRKISYSGYSAIWDGTVYVDAASRTVRVGYYDAVGARYTMGLVTEYAQTPFTLTASALAVTASAGGATVNIVARPIYIIGIVATQDLNVTVTARPGP